MKNTTRKLLALLLALLLVAGTASVGFAASVGQVTDLALASRTSTQIKIKWKTVAKASGYLVEIYDADEEEWEIEDYTTNAYYVDKSLTPGTKYTYRVKAYVKDGSSRVFGKASDKLNVLTNPERVMKVKVASSSPTAVKLQWEAAAGATSYMLYQCATENGKFKQIAETKKTTYKLTFDSAPGKLYFKVKASAKIGSLVRNADASPAFAVSLLPETVSEISVRDSSPVTVDLKWAASKGATGYLVLLKDATSNGEYVQVGKTEDTAYQVNFPAAPGTVWFKVQAISKLNGVTSKGKASAAVKLSLKPEKVTALFVMSATSSTLTLTWNAASGASAYEVSQRDETFNYNPIATVTDTSYTVTGLESDREYYFFVTAIADYNGSVLRAGKSEAIKGATGFGNIEGFNLQTDDAGKASLSWKAVRGADGYLVEKSVNGKTDWEQIADIKDCVFEVSSVEPGGVIPQGVNYFYRACAYTYETGEKKTTPYTDVVQLKGKSDTPTITRAGTASQHCICLEWTTMPGADGYEIELFNAATGKWEVAVTSLNDAKTFRSYKNESGVDTTYVTYKTVESGTYQFRMRSFVNNNGTYDYSDYSNTFSHEYIYSPEPAKQYSDAIQKSGIVGYLYDPNENVFFTAEDPWQRNFGFNEVYDIASPIIMLPYDTERIKFTCHGDEKWMIQPWKGQYGMILYGCEVGVYKQYSARDAEHYDCAKDEDMLMMDMKFYKREPNATSWPDKPEFSRPYGSYWWVTGFQFGFVRMVSPIKAWDNTNFTDFRVDFRITMMDFDMKNAFKAALLEAIESEKAKYGFSRFTIRSESGLDFEISYV